MKEKTTGFTQSWDQCCYPQYPKEITVSDICCILFTPTIDLDLTDDNEAGGSDGKTASGGDDGGDGDGGAVISSQESFSEKVTNARERLGKRRRNVKSSSIPGQPKVK